MNWIEFGELSFPQQLLPSNGTALLRAEARQKLIASKTSSKVIKCSAWMWALGMVPWGLLPVAPKTLKTSENKEVISFFGGFEVPTTVI